MKDQQVLLGSADFDEDFQFAVRDDGHMVRFTRTERRMLQHFVQHAGAVLSRNQILDAVIEVGSDTSDRNVDFAINRLRRKLADAPANPKFIATRYGEGYVWVARPRARQPAAAGAYLVVGPLRGIDRIGCWRGGAEAFAQSLTRRIESYFSPARRVVLDAECPSADAFQERWPTFAVDLTFLREGQRLDCIVMLMGFRSATMISVMRHTIAEATDDPSRHAERAAILAEQIGAQLWDEVVDAPIAHGSPLARPLPVTMAHAEDMFTGDPRSWRENDERLRKLCATEPANRAAKIMLATNIHSKYILGGFWIMFDEDRRAADLDEIEALVTRNLRFVQGNPVHALAAAKLLHFLGRGYGDLAMSIAERAHAASTTVAASLTTVGQLRVFSGDIDAGLASYDQARALSEPNSQFEVYLIVLTCQALCAAGRWEALERERTLLCERRPTGEFFFDILFPPISGDISSAAEMMLSRMTPHQASCILLWMDFVGARLFRDVEHRENTLRAPLALVTERFGRDVVPSEVSRHAPGLVAAGKPRPRRATGFPRHP